ncbi:AI-2E family transporter [Arthrobacter psychrochitiniphilus]|uniref:AI-2E family transporter n=1 Tax=Arthrobacter psychrochitiniphilus TaxID=291045 RepID=A0A2V3DPX3_9MICC|nr:AI-2E family transporter [Arthrobacter psychrochitiniphilus]NYG16950.1 putative PurR-regulated permease PerM [Arthrobacter psychrochitiniphilus]PXA64817.1 AI-2E family transporter [Arthrobacter psychrochitiniphilus]
MPTTPTPPTRGLLPQDRVGIWRDGFGRTAIRSAQALLILTFASVVLWAATRVPVVIIPVLIALILASAISPLVHWLTKRHWPRALAVLSAFVGILAVFGGVVTGVVFLIRSQAQDLVSRADDGIDQLHSFMNNGPYPISDAQINSIRESVQKFITSSAFGTEALTGLRVAGEIGVGAVLMAVILFFFLKDGQKIRDFLFGFLPPRQRRKAHTAAERSTVVLGGYLRGTSLIALIDGLIVGIAVAIMQIPLAVPLGVFVFIGGFIPIIGATVAGSLAVLVALIFNGPIAAVVVLAIIVGVNQLEHHLLQPLLMGKVLSIHGLVILLALAAGSTLAGLVGALLAVPLTAVGWTIIKTWLEQESPPAQRSPVAHPDS